MKIFINPWLKPFFLIMLFAMPFFVVEDIFSMGELALVDELVSRGLDEGIAKEFALTAEEGLGVSAQDFMQDGISQGVKGAYKTTLENTLKELGPQIEALKASGAKFDDVAATVKAAFENQQKPMFESIQNTLKEEGEFSAAERSLVGGEVAAGLDQIPNELASEGRVVKVKVKGTPDASTEGSLNKSDNFEAKRNDLTAAEDAGAPQEEISAKETEVNNAEKDVLADQKARANENDTKLKQAEEKFKSAQEKVDKATTSQEKITANEELAQAKGELEEAQKVKANDDNLTYKQKYQQAKNERIDKFNEKAKANDELNEAKANRDAVNKDPEATPEQKAEAEGKVNEKQALYEKAGRELEATEKNLIEQENELMERSGSFSNKLQKTQIIGSRLGRGSLEFVKGLPAAAWDKIKFVLDQVVISVLFGAPNMVIEGYKSAMAKKKLLETKRNYQRWGNTWIKIPDFFINEEDPANSLNLYVGVPNEGYPITDSMLGSAHYYVVKSDYTPWGSSSIFDNISDMVNLNTGFVFVSDGQAADSNSPTLPFIDAKKAENGLINQLDSLSGKARAGLKTEGIEYYVDSYEAGYKGNAEVYTLFKTVGEPSYTNLPPLLVPTVKALQSGTSFGVDKSGKALYLVQGFRGFNKSEVDNGNKIMAALSGSSDIANAPAAAKDDNYVAQGMYIYQTKDTPIVDLVKKQISASDPEKQILLDSIVDYVVMLDSDNQVVPLMTPQPMVLPTGSKDSAFVHYALNPQIDKMKSLVDGSSRAYNASGVLEDATMPDLKAPTPVVTQISAMQSFFNQKIKYGPFKYNGTTLTIDKALADANIFVYKAAGFLEGGFDDYFVALEAVKDEKTGKTKLAAISLPSSGIVFFVSLVTSRFYDKDLQPYAPPVAPILRDYYITKDNTVATGKPEDTSLPQAQAPLYTLFVQGEYNPSPKPANFVGSLPVPPYWALNSSMFSLQDVSPISDALAKQPSLLGAIKASHEHWIAVLDIDDPGALSKKMGPFNFTTGEVENVHLRALNATTLKLGYYIYTSGRYPDEYLVVSKNAEGTDGVGEEFAGQQYLISLSNGNVYDAQANGDVVGKPMVNLDQLITKLDLTNAGVEAHITNEQKTLNAWMKSIQADPKIKAQDKKIKIATINAQIAAIPSQKTTMYDVVSTIKQSQAGYNRAMINKLFSDDLVFGGRQLYLPKESYLAGQYIYADVTDLGNPLDENGQEIKAVADQVKDYYVTYETTGDASPVYANPLNKNTTKIFSLVSGGGFDHSGTFVTSYQTVKISDKDGQKVYSDLNDFVNEIFGIIKLRMENEKRSQIIVLQNRIKPLLDAQYAAVKDELKKIAEAKKNSLDQYPSKETLATNLFMDSLPYVQRSPALLPLYLKKLTGANKYYLVVPPTTLDPESDEGKTYEAARTFIDYDIDIKDHTGPNAKGMIYNRGGKPVQLLTGWILNSMRAYAGLIIDANGNQSLGIGIDHPSLPITVKTKDGKTQSTMIDTGIKAPDPKAPNVQFTYYYNTQIDNYLAQIKAGSSNYFIDLTAGYGYNLDGTPRWYEAPVYTDAAGDVLLVGVDSFGLKKVAFKKRGAAKYLIYNQMISFGDIGTYQFTDENNNVITKKLSTSGSVKFPEYGNAQGSYFTMLSDSFGDPGAQGAAPVSAVGGMPTLQELRIGYAYLDATGNQLAEPFYVVWDQVQVENPLFEQNSKDPTNAQQYLIKTNFVGKFTQSLTWKFSLLNYVQTRNSTSSLSGIYKPEDFYNFPRGACDSELLTMADDSSKPCIKTPKLVGILFTNEQGKQVLKEVFYENQRCPLTIKAKNVFSSSYIDSAGKTRPITVKLESSQTQDSPITAHWLSITDGNKILDFAHEPLQWDTSPKREDIIEPNNLDYKKRMVWKLNVSGFVSNPVLNTSWASFPGIHANALATNLNAIKKVEIGELVGCSIAGSIQKEIQKGLNSITVDEVGQLYLPYAPTSKISNPVVKRYVYTFGQNEFERDLSFYDPGLDGWSVDLNNGILYEPATLKFGAYPAGVALQPANLAELLGFLRLYVDRDKQGNPKALGIANCNLTPALVVKPALKR